MCDGWEDAAARGFSDALSSRVPFEEPNSLIKCSCFTPLLSRMFRTSSVQVNCIAFHQTSDIARKPAVSAMILLAIVNQVRAEQTHLIRDGLDGCKLPIKGGWGSRASNSSMLIVG